MIIIPFFFLIQFTLFTSSREVWQTAKTNTYYISPLWRLMRELPTPSWRARERAIRHVPREHSLFHPASNQITTNHMIL